MRAKMKALIISSPTPYGRGGQIRAYKILEHVVKLGLDAFIVGEGIPLEIIDKLKVYGYKVLSVNRKAMRKWSEGCIASMTMSAIRELVKRCDYDIIVSQSEHPKYVLTAYIASKIAGLPWTAIVNSYLYINPLYRYNAMPSLTRFLRTLATLKAMNTTLIHLVSNAIRYELWKEGYELKNYEVLDVPLGIEHKLVDEVLKHETTKIYDLAFMGFFTPEKGIYDLIHILYKLKKKGMRINMLMLGKFESNEVERGFLSKATKFGVADMFVFKGYLTGMYKYRELARSKVFVYPSRVDALPISVLEALALGLPVVTWDAPYTRQYSTKAVIRVHSYDEYVNKIIELLKEEDRAYLGKAGRSYTKKFTWENAALNEYKAYIKTIKWWAYRESTKDH